MPRESEPFKPPALAAALKEAAIAAAIAFGLFVLMVGVKTDQGPTGALVITTRFGIVAVLVGGVFAGAFLRALIGAKIRASFDFLTPTFRAIAASVGPYVPTLLLGLALIAPMAFYAVGNRYLIDLGILILTYTMLGLGLNIVVGLAGLLDLGYVAFYAVGAYSYALLAHHFGLSFWICLPVAGILAAFAGVLLGFPVLRLRGDYLAIVTLGFGEIIRLILLNWQDLTGGPNGIVGIPGPSFFGLPFNSSDQGFAATFGIPFSPTQKYLYLYYVILVLALLTNWVSLRLRRLPIGRAWEALREDEIACRALGINTTTTKLTAFAMGAMFGGFAGAFFATRQGFISPESFTFHESALVLAIVVLGGMGSQLGVALAALAMIGGFELFRGLDQYRMLVFGMAMVLLMIWRPRGLIGHRAPTVFLKHNQAISSDLVKEGHG